MNQVAKKWQTAFLLTVMIAAVVFSVSVFIPPKYKTEASLVVLLNGSDNPVAGNYVARILVEAVNTTTFISDIKSANLDISKEIPDDLEKAKEEWNSKVQVEKVQEVGVLNLSTVGNSRSAAEQLMQAVIWNFSNNGKKYYDQTGTIVVKIIDGPLTGSRPVSPNILLNTILGFIAGIVISVFAVRFFGEDEEGLKEKKVEPIWTSRTAKEQFPAKYPAARLEEEYFSLDKTPKKEESAGINAKKMPMDIQTAISNISKAVDTFKKVGPAKVENKDVRLEERKPQIAPAPKEVTAKKKGEIKTSAKEPADQSKNISVEKEAVSPKAALGQKASEKKEERKLEVRNIRTAAVPFDLPFIEADKFDWKKIVPQEPAESQSPVEEDASNGQEAESLIVKNEVTPQEEKKKENIFGKAATKGEPTKEEDREPTEEEIKERLNKLLKGEL